MNIFHLKFNRRPSDAYWYFRLTALVIVTAIAVGLFIILYRDFYQTIVQAESVLVLRREVALKDIDLELFRKVKGVDDNKRKSILPPVIPDPFATAKAETLFGLPSPNQ